MGWTRWDPSRVQALTCELTATDGDKIGSPWRGQAVRDLSTQTAGVGWRRAMI